MILRQPAAASEHEHDLTVVGGGIQGAMLALEAARRGYRPLLLERADFGGATSWNSLRIVHGGLRYLQSLDLPRFRESVRERAWYLRAFPQLIRPLPCLMPLYGQGLHRPAVLRLALMASDWLDRGRNVGLAPERQLPAGRVLPPKATLELAPVVEPKGLVGAALWHDATMVDAPRLLIEILHWACAAGATCLNYVEVSAPIVEGSRLVGVVGRDRVSGTELEFRAPVAVNCAGPATDRVIGTLGGEAGSLFAPSLAFNVLLDREWPEEPAVAVTARRGSGRTYFLRALEGRLLAGTFHAPRPEEAIEPAAREKEIGEFIADLNSALPGLRLRESEACRVFAGLLPARCPGSVELAARPAIVDHAGAGGPAGLFTVAGVKYTTARAVAERTLRRIYGPRLRSYGAGRDGPKRDLAPGSAESGADRSERPPLRPRRSYREFRAGWDETPDLAKSEIARIVAEESVLRVDDLIFRRTDWAAAEPESVEEMRRLLGDALPVAEQPAQEP